MKKIILTIAAGVLLTALMALQAQSDTPAADKPEITIRELPAQTVLYTIFRGPYKNTGPAIGQLFAAAGKNGIRPMGSPSYIYLNNPNLFASEHWLTEIRIPVSEDALKLAGTLGEMTDVKKVPAMTVAVAIKPEGMTDPAPVYDKLHKWILEEKYIMVESACEIMLTNAMGGDYSQMKSEIMIPVAKSK